MAIRPIIHIPDPRLKTRTAKVEKIDEEIRTLVKDMFDTMYDAPGVGLAAPQIGVMKRVLVIDAAGRSIDRDEEPDENAPPPDPEPIAMINPEILWESEELQVCEEGCLSIPEYFAEVERPARIRIRYQTPENETVECEVDGFKAVVVQHEIDHLDGVLFIDYLSRLKRERVMKKFEKAAKRAAAG